MIQKSGVVIDGNGFSLVGSKEGNGIYLESLTNVTVKNLSIENFRYGIYLENSSYNKIEDNNLSSLGDGIVLDHWCVNNSIVQNNISSIGCNSFFLGNSSNNIIAENKATSGGNILDSYNASYNQILNNQLSTRTTYSPGILFRGGVFSESIGSFNNEIRGNEGSYNIQVNGRNNLISENSAESIQIEGATNSIFNNNASLVILDAVYCTLHDNRIIGAVQILGDSNNITQNYIETVEKPIIHGEDEAAIKIEGQLNNILSANIIVAHGGRNGIIVDGGGGNIMLENYITAVSASGIELIGYGQSAIGNKITNSLRGIYLKSVSDCLIAQNLITNNQYGVVLLGASENVISGNNITSNGFGVYSERDVTYRGVYVPVTGNNITGNVISMNTEASIYLNITSSANLVFLNNVTNNSLGIGFGDDASNNTIYSNNFVSNEIQAIVFPSIEHWNLTYPSGSNYWSNYGGSDLNSGPYQNVTGRDDIGDTPFVIDENNLDYYPQISPVQIPNLNIPNVVPEFPSFLVSALFMILSTAITAVLFRLRRYKMNIH